jgi:hypothetical protein
MTWRLHPTKFEAPRVALVAAPDQFYPTLPEPRRRKAPRATALIAAGCFFVGFAPFEEAVSADRFAQPISQPYPAKRGLDTASQQSLIHGASHVVPPLDTWYRPLVDPVRLKPRSADFPATIEGLVPAAETVTLDRWGQPLSDPTIAKPRQLFESLFTPVNVLEQITADKWYHALSEPVRIPPHLTTGSQQYIAYIGAAPFEETVTVDRWLQPLYEPKRFRRALLVADQWHITMPPHVVVPFEWFVPLSTPPDVEPPILADRQQYLAFHPTPIVTISWFAPLEEPRRFRRSLNKEQQVFPGFVHAPAVVPDIGWMPLEEPRRFKQALHARFQHQPGMFVKVTINTNPERPLYKKGGVGRGYWRGRR